MIGGTKNYYQPNANPIPDPDPAKDAEHFVPSPGSGVWTVQGGTMASSRIYHSTALLLPSGKVLSAGGEFGWLWAPTATGGRTDDFQVFNPPYMTQNRPTIISAPPTMNLMVAGEATTHKVYYSYPWDDANVAKVVLMAPGSITHHSDMHQRYVECAVVGLGIDATGNFIRFYPPLRMGVPSPAGSHALPGYYMLFILTDKTDPQFRGVPSEAAWVRLQ